MTGVELITKERHRQITKEGYDNNHDDAHDDGELASAAACYAMTEGDRGVGDDDLFAYIWPFDPEYWKPTQEDRIKELTKAGALIAAEIDRLQRI